MQKIIIGIDPGTLITGYGIIKVFGSSNEVVDFGCIRPPSSEKLSERYLIIFNSLEKILEMHQPIALAVETQYFSKNVQSILKLGMARGAVIVAAKRKNIPVYEYSPTRAKKAVVGCGNASKRQVQIMVQALLNLKSLPEPNDAADALALALCHAHTMCYDDPSHMEI